MKEPVHVVADLIQVLIYQIRSAIIYLENRKHNGPGGGGG